jgi:hypothetical protein
MAASLTAALDLMETELAAARRDIGIIFGSPEREDLLTRLRHVDDRLDLLRVGLLGEGAAGLQWAGEAAKDAARPGVRDRVNALEEAVAELAERAASPGWDDDEEEAA